MVRNDGRTDRTEFAKAACSSRNIYVGVCSRKTGLVRRCQDLNSPSITVTTADTSDTFDTVASGEAGASTDVVDACSTAPDVDVVPPLREKRSGIRRGECDASCSRGTAQIEK